MLNDFDAGQAHVARWAQEHALSPVHIDCVIAVMLKILDGKCKMQESEKIVMASLYDHLKTQPGQKLGAEIHHLIAAARNASSDRLRNLIYEQRVLAETGISRPVMKAFKAMIRHEGLLDGAHETEDEGA